jgi:hypothetical protein
VRNPFTFEMHLVSGPQRAARCCQPASATHWVTPYFSNYVAPIVNIFQLLVNMPDLMRLGGAAAYALLDKSSA